MEQLPNNLAIIAAAGSRKTQQVIESALAVKGEPVLITTYTNENQRQIIERIKQVEGVVPPNITVLGWFSFLIGQGARPYQRALTNSPGKIQGLNFKGRRNRFTSKEEVDRYYFDSTDDMYRDGVSDFVCEVNSKTDGAVVSRLEKVFRHVLIDEIQDLVGYDLDVLDLLFRSNISVTVVGDPRQATLATNLASRRKQYRGAKVVEFLREREDICVTEERNENHRSNQTICDFADDIYPDLPKTTSAMGDSTEHDGIFLVPRDEARDYYERHRPVVLRNSKAADALGLPARNFGVAKGSTYERVLIFPTKPILTYLEDRDASKLKAPERLYVAATRARYSVAFVVPNGSKLLKQADERSAS